MSTPTKKASSSNEPIKPQQRLARGKHKVHIDTYKLLLASKIANLAPSAVRKDDAGFEPKYIEQEHVHFYRTYDSNGKKQTKSTSIAGHHHNVTEIPQGPGLPPKILIGPAVKEARAKNKKTRQWEIIEVPADENQDLVENCHVHEWEYVYSEEVESREMNKEALQLQGMEAQKGAPVAGVTG